MRQTGLVSQPRRRRRPVGSRGRRSARPTVRDLVGGSA